MTPAGNRRLWRVLLALSAPLAAAALTAGDNLWQFDTWLYDQTLRFRTASAESDARILIVAIDEQSLADIGQWPWSRARFADAIRSLENAGTRGIAIDLLFAEEHGTDPAGDFDLTTAMAESTRVVLPVSIARLRQHGAMIEVNPLPEFAQAAMALGHTDLAEDRDGMTRGVYLRAGLGEARWSTLSLALLEGGRRMPLSELPGLMRPATDPAGPDRWIRDRYVLLPFTGPAGTFTHVSFSELIGGNVPDELARDRYVIIGMSASGHGGGVRTPVGKSRSEMHGIEFHAQVLKMLLDDGAVTPLTLPVRALASFLIVLLPFALYGLDSLRKSLILIGATMLLMMAVSATLLFGFGQWLPPAVPLAVLASCMPLLTAVRLRRFQHMAVHDPMTGVFNRRGLAHAFTREWSSAMRTGRAIALLLIDVDYFKAYNDRYGHRRGDIALGAIAQVIKGAARRARDAAARTGGEEFALLLPETEYDGALDIAERLRVGVFELALNHENSPHRNVVTVSIGIHACVPAAGESAELMYERADQALYRAKEEGRNRVCRFADIMDGT